MITLDRTPYIPNNIHKAYQKNSVSFGTRQPTRSERLNPFAYASAEELDRFIKSIDTEPDVVNKGPLGFAVYLLSLPTIGDRMREINGAVKRFLDPNS